MLVCIYLYLDIRGSVSTIVVRIQNLRESCGSFKVHIHTYILVPLIYSVGTTTHISSAFQHIVLLYTVHFCPMILENSVLPPPLFPAVVLLLLLFGVLPLPLVSWRTGELSPVVCVVHLLIY